MQRRHRRVTVPERPEPRTVPGGEARESFFSSLSRELRMSLDEAGRFVHLSGAWQSLLGWRPERLDGWHWEEIVHPADCARFDDALRRLGDGLERDIEVRLALATGGHRTMSWTLVAGSGADRALGLGRDPARRPGGSPSPQDLTRRNAELVAQITQLEQRYVAVERFAAQAAHQLFEPLIVAESSSIMLSEELADILDPGLRDRLEAIGRGAARTRRLIEALLTEAHTADRPPVLCPVDSSKVLEETLAALSRKMEERRVTSVTDGLPIVYTEPRLLSIIFDNLLTNAVKYGPRSGGEVRITADREPSGWRFSVHSEGAPIDRDEAKRIFEPFQRAAGERRASGSGLGLAICARLVERLGGTIGVEPGEAAGNDFYFLLPDAA